MEFEKFVLDDIAEIENKIKAMIPPEPKEVYNLLEEYIFRGGKRIRPAIIMLVFRALGGKDKQNAISVAALIELFHNFTLIHDDIEDSSEFRRGKPTLHLSHGIPIALNSGDAIYTIIWNNLLALDLPAEKKIKLVSILGRGFQRVVEGQGIELNWYKEKKIDIYEEEYYNMISGKTGALMGTVCEAGAYLAYADPESLERFYNFGKSLGIAFQIQDDILNLIGDFKEYKKEIGGDITEGKRTLMIIHAMAHSNEEEKKKLLHILLSNTRDRKKIDYAISIMKKYGSIDYAKLKARCFVEKANSFIETFQESKEKNELKKLLFCITNRKF
ncbi:MAG: polyprenyl synthetase family protein [Candidatus Micrarchaeota archaeon]